MTALSFANAPPQGSLALQKKNIQKYLAVLIQPRRSSIARLCRTADLTHPMIKQQIHRDRPVFGDPVFLGKGRLILQALSPDPGAAAQAASLQIGKGTCRKCGCRISKYTNNWPSISLIFPTHITLTMRHLAEDTPIPGVGVSP